MAPWPAVDAHSTGHSALRRTHEFRRHLARGRGHSELRFGPAFRPSIDSIPRRCRVSGHCLRLFRRTSTLLWVFVAFLAFGWVVDPVPGINEPHYLGKARHFWDPQWCAGDLFFESANAHAVFYATIGWLSLLLPLPGVALVGRLIGSLVLAWGWTQMIRSLCGSTVSTPTAFRRAPLADGASPPNASQPQPPAFGVDTERRPSDDGVLQPAVWLATAAYLSLYLAGTLAGEWMVGGIEGKVIAYGLAFAAFARLAEGAFLASAALAGLAVAFHPVAGGWLTLAAVGAVAAEWLPVRRNRPAPPLPFPGWKRVAAAAGVWSLAAAPGLVPAAAMLVRSDPVAAWQANVIQVYYRLRHHLDPLSVAPAAWARYAAMLALLWALLRSERHACPIVAADAPSRPAPATGEPARRLMARVTIVAVAIAAIAVLAGLPGRPESFGEGRWRLAFLKLYPLRLLDVILPVALAAAATRRLLDALRPFAGEHDGSYRTGMVATVWLLGLLAVPAVIPPPGRMPREWQPAWVTMCRWIRDNTPPQAIFLTPRTLSRTFKWYAPNT